MYLATHMAPHAPCVRFLVPEAERGEARSQGLGKKINCIFERKMQEILSQVSEKILLPAGKIPRKSFAQPKKLLLWHMGEKN